jgi:hypothetical protein
MRAVATKSCFQHRDPRLKRGATVGERSFERSPLCRLEPAPSIGGPSVERMDKAALECHGGISLEQRRIIER